MSGVTLSLTTFTYPNVTLTVSTGHTQQGNYYCIVKYNGVMLGRGNIEISIKGKIIKLCRLFCNIHLYYSF